MVWLKLILACVLLILIQACTLGPEYTRPDLDVPDKFIETENDNNAFANLEWWEFFQDPQLKEYIRESLAANKELNVALSRIEVARKLVTVVRSDQFPTIDASGGAGRGRESRDIIPGADTEDNYNASLDLAYELDVWGKFRRATEAQIAELMATEAAYRNVMITLVADVATTYFLLLDLDNQLLISEETLASREDSLKIMEARYSKGTIPELDVNQAQIEAADAAIAIEVLNRRIVQTENSLKVLLGQNPGPVKRGDLLTQKVIPPEIPAGLPSELLQRRPDLIAAEQQLRVQTALIGVAEAVRYPSFTLTGRFGYESTELSNLDTGDAKSWNLFGGIFAPIFNAGRLSAQVEIEKERAKQAQFEYEQTLLQALSEVENSLVAIRTYRQQFELNKQQVVAAQNAARLSRARYDGGVVDYLEVLESERTQFRVEINESEALQLYINAIVELYLALGGGWEYPPEEAYSMVSK
ncbi:MAG: efflux transporter outer membrane subunit [Pseudomonadota bacterium]